MTSEEAAVAAANTAFYQALEARDLVAMDRIWAHEESASCVHPGWHRLDGWTEIRRSWENIFTNARPWSVFCEDVRVEVSGHLAWVTCVEAITPFGADPDEETARMQATNVLARRNGRWLLLHHHASPSPSSDPDEDEEPVN